MTVRYVAVAFLSAVLLAGPAAADSVTSKLIAHDRVAHRLILEDKTIFEYNPDQVKVPDNLKAGDAIEIEYIGGEEGIQKIQAVKLVDTAKEKG